MLATLPSGEILWCNEAFENLLGWTNVELVGRLTWKDLTSDQEELSYDLALVQETVDGTRTDYQLQKEYRTKNGSPKRVVIDVLRYPTSGEFDCFLVAVCPVDHGVQFALNQLNEIRSLIIVLMDSQPTGLTFDKAIAFSKEHPVLASILGIIFSTLLFGERVVEIVKLFGVKIGE